MSDTALIITVIVSMILFLVGREVVCWYWKINENIKLQEEILNQLKQLAKNQDLPKT